MDAFNPVYILPTKFENAINAAIIRLLQNFHHYYYGCCRLLADGTRIFHLEMLLLLHLQFWTEDLNPVTLGIDTEYVYTTFFYTSTSHTLCQQSDETLFGTLFSMQLSPNDCH